MPHENFIQKADIKKGALRKKLGTATGKNIPKAEITQKISALKKKGEGDKKLTGAESKTLKELVLARTFNKIRPKAKKKTLMTATAN